MAKCGRLSTAPAGRDNGAHAANNGLTMTTATTTDAWAPGERAELAVSVIADWERLGLTL